MNPTTGTGPIFAAPASDFAKALIIAATILLGLWVDQSVEVWGQIGVSIWTWLVFFWLLGQARSAERTALMAVLVVATIGEIICSLVWAVYSYRLANLPPFVPPGHVLLFALGCILAKPMPRWAAWFIVAAAAPYALYALLGGFDSLSAVLFIIFLLAMVWGRATQLYATMFVLSLAMELYGTWLGNWTWTREVPGLWLTAANPPGCIGAGYCLLDLAVLGSVRWIARLEGFRLPPQTATLR